MALSRSPVSSAPQQSLTSSLWNALVSPPGGAAVDDTAPTIAPGQILWLQDTSGNAAATAAAQRGQTDQPEEGFAPMPLRPFLDLPPEIPPLAPAPLESPWLVDLLLFAARWAPALLGMWPTSTASPELDTPPPEALRDPVPEPAPDGPLEPTPELGPLAPDDDPCRVQLVCPHKGGDGIHDACADAVTDPGLDGCDVLVNGKNFDAFNAATRTLWEVKTTQISTYANDWVRKFEINKQLKNSAEDAETALACGFNYALSVSDRQNYDLLEKSGKLSQFVDLVFRPECLEYDDGPTTP